ncbi:hypothetical protein [Microbulbifer elongatus]|uniref:hypothetical protein n=1 Tax=Microbulbifer elongatus TaxID=86173 RepID=UPI001CFE57D6|nr:hypothetical protein [Microbulbifer elongatus]
MIYKKFNNEISIKLTEGHLIVLWDLLSSKLAGKPLNVEFSKVEKRVIWALADLCEVELERLGWSEYPEEWEATVRKARMYCQDLPADFLS